MLIPRVPAQEPPFHIKPLVARKVPVVTGEIDEDDCAHGYVDQYMAWADAHGTSYLGWTWNPWPCNHGRGMISDWSGTPNSYGVGIRDHLALLAATARRRLPCPRARALRAGCY